MSELYARAGVDILAGDRAVDLIKSAVRSTQGPRVLGGVGAFAGLYALTGYAEPVLVASTDGVGTKLKVASELGRYDSIGADLVNLSINDVLTTGARPLFFLDYIAVGRLVPEHVEALVTGMASACREAGCAIIGGETAEMRDVYRDGDFDLAGFVVGVVERSDVVDGRLVQPGDDIWGLPSNGLHTNGYTLARKVLAQIDLNTCPLPLEGTLGDELLAPHPSYLSMMLPLLDRKLPRAMAHITGGGIPGNLARTLPEGLGAEVFWNAWPRPGIYDVLQEEGGLPLSEMVSVFNLGLGFTFVASPASSNQVAQLVPEARRVGKVIPFQSGEPRVTIRGLT
ncbi:MAG: phosphoribosylformylglycinamidine cyclo-ligase [Chloroflexota bacterium]